MQESLTRRRFLELCAGAIGAVAASSALEAIAGCTPGASPAASNANLPSGVLTPGSGLTAKVAAVSDLSETPKAYQLNAQTTVYAYERSGAPVVVSNICTHLACPVAWNNGTDTFICPCHGSVYNLDGQVVSGPAPQPLMRFQTQVQSGDLYVQATQASG